MMATKRGTPRLLLLLIVVAALVVGCDDEIDWMGDPGAPGVVVIGDSLTQQAQGITIDEVGKVHSHHLLDEGIQALGFQSYVHAEAGMRYPQAYADMWTRPDRTAVDPAVVVIALGTNDSRLIDGVPAVPLDASRAALHAWLQEIPEDCVRLIGVNEGADSWGLDISGPLFNAMVEQEAASHPNASFVAWEPDPSWFSGDPHMSDEGDLAYRTLILDAVASCP